MGGGASSSAAAEEEAPPEPSPLVALLEEHGRRWRGPEAGIFFERDPAPAVIAFCEAQGVAFEDPDFNPNGSFPDAVAEPSSPLARRSASASANTAASTTPLVARMPEHGALPVQLDEFVRWQDKVLDSCGERQAAWTRMLQSVALLGCCVADGESRHSAKCGARGCCRS